MGGVFLKSLSSQVDAEATVLGSGVGSPSCSRPQLPEWPQEMPNFIPVFGVYVLTELWKVQKS